MPNLETIRRVVLKPAASTAASPPTFTFLASPSVSGSTTITATGINFGTASANRRIYVFLLGGFGTVSINTGTSFIGGSTNPDFSGQALSSGSGVSMWWATAVQPSGTTGQTVTLDFASNPFSFGVFGIYSVDDTTLNTKSPTIATNTASSATTVNTNVATLANGCIVTALWTAAGTSSQSISSATESFTTDATSAAGSGGLGHANGVAANASSNVTWSWTTSSDAGIANFAFR